MEGALDECLMKWVQSFEGTGKVESLASLSDGITLWTILQQIDGEYFAEDLPEPQVNATSDWTRKWQNLKHIEKLVSIYYRDIGSGQEQISMESLPDVKAIAAEASTGDTEKLIMTIIRAAMASPETNQRMAQRLMSLGREKALLIANELRSMEDTDYSESEAAIRDESAYESEQETPVEPKTNGHKSGSGTYKDPLLEREEQLLQAQATIDKLEASHQVAQKQLVELRQDKERLEEAFDSYRNEIDTKGRKPAGDDIYKKLQRQADNDRAYIDDLENQVQSTRSTIDNYESQLQRYKDEHDASQQLRDEVQLLKADNEDLSQKIKANENLKKKIQALQEHEKTNASLREEIKDANERLEGLEKLKRVQAGLEKEIIEKQGLIRNQEYQITELTTMRRTADHNSRTLEKQLQDATQRHDRDHETIQGLRARLQETTLDEPQDEATTTADQKQEDTAVEQSKKTPASDEETQHLLEKVTMLQQQLETADVRLKQASERKATLEEQQQGTTSVPEALQKAEAQVNEQEHTIASLRREIETLAKQKPDVPKPSQDMAALQRENHLMATAWYDLSSRLQSNGVSLSRRRQEPKSWISKQRMLVGPNAAQSR